MHGADEYISSGRGACGVGHRTEGFAGVRASVQPQEVRAASTLCLLGAKQFLRTDYRGLAAHLADHPSLRETLGLTHVPHFTTFQKASPRLLLTAPARRLLESTVRLHLGRKRRVKRGD